MGAQNEKQSTKKMLNLAIELSMQYNTEIPKDINNFQICKKFIKECIKKRPPTDAQIGLMDCLAASYNTTPPAKCYQYEIECDKFIKKCKKGLIKDPYQIKIDKTIKTIENYIYKNKELIERLKITKQDIDLLHNKITKIIFKENNSKIINKIIKNDENEIILLIISAIKENLKPITLNKKEQQWI